MIIGFSIYCVASLLCSFATTFPNLVALRFLQGLGGGACFVVGMGTIRDRFQGAESAKRTSQVEMIMTISPALAPIVASSTIGFAPWPMAFWTLSFLSFVCFLVIWRFYPETNLVINRSSFSFRNLFSGYAHLLTRPKYLGFGIINVLTIAWLWGEYATIPFVFVETLKVPAQNFGYFLCLNLTAFFIGTIVNQLTVQRLGINRLMLTGIFIVLADTLLLALMQMFLPLSPFLVAMMKWPAQFGAALTTSNAMTRALENAGHESGSGAAMITCGQLLVGAFYIYQSTHYFNGTLWPLLGCMLLSSCVALLAFLGLRAFYPHT
jgi:DHA1 family bicyclomycin/chloramphenicol resistance-like MFS transporter